MKLNACHSVNLPVLRIFSILVARMPYIQTNGCTFYLEEYGAGPTLLLLSDLLETIETEWRRFFPSFSRHFHTIAIDFRGHGRSNNPTGTLTLPMLVEDLHGLMDVLEIERALVCATGAGGLIAFLNGVRRPGTIERLVTHGTKLLWSRSDATQTASTLLTRATSDGAASKLKRQVADCVESFHDDGPGAAELTKATFPVLLTIGDAAGGSEEDLARHTLAQVPHGELRVFSGAGNALHTVPTEDFLQTAKEFLGATGRDDSPPSTD
jgi:pimeloyl-ACP methyl ester carboxylesterase